MDLLNHTVRRNCDISPNASVPIPYPRQALFWTAVAFGLGILLWKLRPVLTPFLLSGLIAYMLQPGVEWLVRHRTPRGLAAILMMLFFSLLVTLLMLLVLVVVHSEGPELKHQIPVFVEKLNAWLHPQLVFLGLGPLDLTNVRDIVTGQLGGSERTVAVAAWHYLRTSGNMVIMVVGNVVLMPLVLFYLLHDRHRMFARMDCLVPRRWLGKTRELVAEMDHMLSQYLRGQFLVIGVLTAFYPIALMIAGFEIALPVGIFSGLAVFIPYAGFATGLALAFLAAFLQFGNWYGFGAVALVYGVGRILESFLLTPRLVGERIGLHPLAVTFALLAFGELFGFFGVLLALPVSAILATALRELRRRYLASALYRN